MNTQPNTSASEGNTSAGINLVTAWQNYGLSMLFIVLVPLLPVVLEWIMKDSLAEGSLLITASIYGAAIAIASNNRFTLGVGLVTALIEAALYGNVVANDSGSGTVIQTTTWVVSITSEQSSQLRFAPQALLVILALLLLSAFERFRRHIQGREEFFEFLKGGPHP